MNRRSRLEIWLNVLDTIREGVNKPTRIGYRANIPWRLLQQILRSLVSQGLVREIDTRVARNYDGRTKRHYEITPKGENILRYFKRASSLLELEETSALRL